jgi:hypothetical protein
LVEQPQELWQKWDQRAARLHPRMEITGEGLTLGAGTVLAGMAKDERGRQPLALDDEPRALALLATAYERPVKDYVLAKMCRAAELWNEGEKALAHIHLAYARLPDCGEEQALRLFVADELIEAGVTPQTLMEAQGFDPAPLALLKSGAAPLAGGQWARQRRMVGRRERRYRGGQGVHRPPVAGSRAPGCPHVAPFRTQTAQSRGCEARKQADGAAGIRKFTASGDRCE